MEDQLLSAVLTRKYTRVLTGKVSNGALLSKSQLLVGSYTAGIERTVAKLLAVSQSM